MTRQRWPEGFQCPRCGGPSRGYMLGRRVHECAGCGYQCSVTAGTIFHKTRTPLTSWFWAIYRMSHDKKGISALQLSKEIGVNYETAWLMQHKIRKAMGDRDRGYTLSGLVEVDEGYVGGEEHGEARKGRGAKSKSVVAVAVEHRAEGQPGRTPVPGVAALSVLPNAGSKSLDGVLKDKIELGSHVLTDGWNGYWHVERNGFVHTATKVVQARPAGAQALPLGPHHAVQPEALPARNPPYGRQQAPPAIRRRVQLPAQSKKHGKDLLVRLLRACINTSNITYNQLVEQIHTN